MGRPLFHFGDAGHLRVFRPRPVLRPSRRGSGSALGRAWLNGPLVWAIDPEHAPLYLFPRACPRILLWRGPLTTPEDGARVPAGARMLALVEEAWRPAHGSGRIYRYAFARRGWRDVSDAGMWVSRQAQRPIGRVEIRDMPAALAAARVALRYVPRLSAHRGLWQTSLRVSGIRLRNAVDWD